jgi:hypothetical protein
MPEILDEIDFISKRDDARKTPAAFRLKKHGWLKAYAPIDEQLEKGKIYLFSTRPGTKGPDTIVGFREWRADDPKNVLTFAESFEADFSQFVKVGERMALYVLGDRKLATKTAPAEYLDFVYKVAFTGFNEWRNRGKP